MTDTVYPCLNIGCDQPRDWTVIFGEKEIDTCTAHLPLLIEMVAASSPLSIVIMRPPS